MPLYLRESDVEELLSPEDAVEAVEGCFGAWPPAAPKSGPAFASVSPEGS